MLGGRAIALLVVSGVAACRGGRGAPTPRADGVTPAQVASHYADLAAAGYEDAAAAARALQSSVEALVASPTAARLAAARAAWLAARTPYLQTEAFR